MAMSGYPGGRGGAARCVMKIELRIECRNLRNRDALSNSDPCAVLFQHDGHKYREVMMMMMMMMMMLIMMMMMMMMEMRMMRMRGG
jgi:predicted nucleic acid-binding Zn ribbon protein